MWGTVLPLPQSRFLMPLALLILGVQGTLTSLKHPFDISGWKMMLNCHYWLCWGGNGSAKVTWVQRGDGSHGGCGFTSASYFVEFI